MKSIFKNIIAAVGVVLMLTACDKTDTLPLYTNGVASVLTSSATTLAPPASDSLNTVLTLTWTDPKYATDTTNYKFVVEIDSTGKNFTKASTKTVMGKRSTTFTAKELNNILLSYGYAFNVPVDMDVRLVSSYGNNNEKYNSNTVKIRMTPYKIPPKVALPASGKLFIVGGATVGGWTNPVPAPSQEFARIDETTWAGIFQLTGGGSYLILPVNGDWGKFGATGSNNSNNPAGDNFKPDGGDLLAPATSGWYKIVFDFQSGKFAVTPYTGVLPTSLFVVGDATTGGWTNPVPVPSQQLTRLNSAVFEVTMPLVAGKSYLFLPVNGSWTDKYGGLGANNSNNVNADEFKFGGSDMLSPPTAGTYKITVNFATGKTAGSSGMFTLVKQ